jgi:hypothetical protein
MRRRAIAVKIDTTADAVAVLIIPLPKQTQAVLLHRPVEEGLDFAPEDVVHLDCRLVDEFGHSDLDRRPRIKRVGVVLPDLKGISDEFWYRFDFGVIMHLAVAIGARQAIDIGLAGDEAGIVIDIGVDVACGSGVYFYRYRSATHNVVRKMMLFR